MHLARTGSYIFLKALRLRFYLNPKVKSQQFLELIKVLIRPPQCRSSQFKSRTKPQQSDSLKCPNFSCVLQLSEDLVWAQFWYWESSRFPCLLCCSYCTDTKQLSLGIRCSQRYFGLWYYMGYPYNGHILAAISTESILKTTEADNLGLQSSCFGCHSLHL